MRDTLQLELEIKQMGVLRKEIVIFCNSYSFLLIGTTFYKMVFLFVLTKSEFLDVSAKFTDSQTDRQTQNTSAPKMVAVTKS